MEGVRTALRPRRGRMPASTKADVPPAGTAAGENGRAPGIDPPVAGGPPPEEISGTGTPPRLHRLLSRSSLPSAKARQQRAGSLSGFGL